MIFHMNRSKSIFEDLTNFRFYCRTVPIDFKFGTGQKGHEWEVFIQYMFKSVRLALVGYHYITGYSISRILGSSGCKAPP